MKSQRKHELQTNELADWIGRTIQKLKPHRQALLYGLLAVLAGIVLLVMFTGGQSAEERARMAFHNARAGADAVPSLRAFVTEYPDAPQTSVAKLELATQLVVKSIVGEPPTFDGEGEGNDEAAEEPDVEPEALLAEARRLAEDVLATERLRPMARLVLARVAVEDGDLAAGKEQFQKIVDEWPASAAADPAKMHLRELENYKPVTFAEEPPVEDETPAEDGEEAETLTPDAEADPPDGPPGEADTNDTDTPADEE